MSLSVEEVPASNILNEPIISIVMAVWHQLNQYISGKELGFRQWGRTSPPPPPPKTSFYT